MSLRNVERLINGKRTNTDFISSPPTKSSLPKRPHFSIPDWKQETVRLIHRLPTKSTNPLTHRQITLLRYILLIISLINPIITRILKLSSLVFLVSADISFKMLIFNILSTADFKTICQLPILTSGVTRPRFWPSIRLTLQLNVFA